MYTNVLNSVDDPIFLSNILSIYLTIH